MRNTFKFDKIKKISQIEEPKITTQEENLDIPLLEDSAPIDVRLDVLNNYFLQCKENGIELTPEMAEKEISESLGIEQEQLLDQEIKDPEIKDIKRDTASEVNNMMSEKAVEHQTVLKYLREKVFKSNYAKAAFVTAMLFLKFNPAQAENGEKKVEDKKDNKTEQTVKKVNPQIGGDDKTFQAGAEDFGRLDKKIKIEATTYFDNDKADLKDKAALSAEFDKFLSSINETNFQDIMDRPFYFKGSSSEVPRPEGNEKLTKGRLTSFRQAWQEAVANHDFSNQISSEKSQAFAAKEVFDVYPTNGPEKGVTRVIDLIDPATGKNFTSEKVAAMGDEERKALQDKCRYTNFEVGSSMFDLASYDESIILIDESGSMEKTKKNMANELRYLNEDKPITIGYFSSSLSKIEKVNGSRQAASLMSKMPTEGSSSERIVSSAIEYLNKAAVSDQEKLKTGEKISSKIMYLATNEGIQDANYINRLAKIAEKTNATINFFVFYESGSKYIKISLTDLNKKIVKIAEAEIMSQQEQAAKNLLVQNERAVKSVDKVIQRLATADYDMHNDLEKAGIKGSAEEIKKQLLDKDFVSLKALEGSRYFKDLMGIKWNLLAAKSNLYKTDQLSVDKQLANSMKINVLEDKAGNAVTFPIYP